MVDPVADRGDHVEVRQRRLDHHDVGALGDVQVDLAQRLAHVAAGPAGTCGGRPAASTRPPRGTGRRRRRRTSRRRPAPRRPGGRPRPGPCGPRRPGRPSSRTGRPCGRRPRPARPPSRRRAPGWRRCPPSRPAASTPQCPCEVNSSRHRSLITTVASPTSAITSRMRDVEDAVRVEAGRAGLVLVRAVRHAEEHQPADARPDRLVRGLAQRLPRVLDDAGQRADRPRLGQALLDEQRQHQLGRGDPGLLDQAAHAPAVRRSRRGRMSGYDMRTPS